MKGNAVRGMALINLRSLLVLIPNSEIYFSTLLAIKVQRVNSSEVPGWKNCKSLHVDESKAASSLESLFHNVE